jgi:uncharacterized protein (TIGR02270 family)
MATSIRQFNVELYEEHLEEASFLYAQRCAYLHDPELTWIDLDYWEERFEAHIDALVVGADLALEVCKQHCASGDFGELHAAIRVFCREQRSDLVFAVLQGLDTQADEMVQAAIDALKAECPLAWYDDLTRIMLGKCKQLVPALAETLAYRRAPIEETLLRVLPNCEEPRRPRVLRALGKVGSDRARATLSAQLRSDDVAVAEAAYRALVRLGDQQALRHGLLAAQLRPWPIAGLGIAGDQTATNVLTDLAKTDKVTDEVLLALGMLGDLRAVSAIFNCLTNPERAPAAALALQTITGAALHEQVFVEEKVDVDELFPDERKKYEETGEAPKRVDGTPFGSSVEQLSVNPAAWRAWLSQHKAEFDPKLRYRHGKPLSPAASLAALQHAQTPNRVRALICEELAVRYRAPVALEVDMSVREQRKHLADLAAWVQTNSGKFTPGMWYFAGRPMAEAGSNGPPR